MSRCRRRDLVTGRSGLLGSTIAGVLADRGWSVIGIDRVPGVIARHFPDAPAPALLAQHGWALPRCIDRVYVIDKAVRELGFQPQRNFRQLLDALASATMPMSGAPSRLRPCA